MGAAVLLLGASYIFYKRRHNKKRTPFRRHDEQVLKRYDLGGDNGTSPSSIETFLQNYTLGRPTRFSYKQLRKYTNNFSHKIGKGGFGSVYKGQLPNGFIIAVKILDESTNHIETQFLNEVLTIGRIHHNHLVRLLGYCFDQSRIALVYEFMVNGSLDKYIHSKKTADNAPSKNTPSLEGKEEEEMAMRMELVGLWCIQFDPSKRPSMRKVVDMLEGNVAIEIPPAPFDANMSPFGTEIKIAPEINTSSFFKTSESGVHR
ncbi:Rust resistance kinase lr10 [Thalictrum thalictroides]|uniref:Rust resistance kinase lr10 n=1 Tax=Thalictrum thalictroides TaxID=46969 RepID=A0A7J6WJP0_THATH|nr:Rust resistance kinase lr10 [Thalictrum thalictroides]